MNDIYQWRLHCNGHGTRQVQTKGEADIMTNTKLRFKLNDTVYIRPKSAKELGVSGRIVDVYNVAKANDKRPGDLPGQGKKRKLAEDVRVSVQPQCFEHDKDAMGGCSSCTCAMTKKGVRPSRLLPVYDIDENGTRRTQSLVLLTQHTEGYRQLATSHLRRLDKVLEIGCSFGECTSLLLRRLILLLLERERVQKRRVDGAGSIVAFDTGSDVIERAQTHLLSEFNRLMPDSVDGVKSKVNLHSKMVHCHRVDALADPKGAYSIAMGNDNRTPSIVLIDIGGNRELKGVVRMIRWVQLVFRDKPPRVIIVKSEALAEELFRALKSAGWERELKGNRSETEGKDPPAKVVQPVLMEDGLIDKAQEWLSTLSPCSSDGSPSYQSSKRMSLQQQSVLPKYRHPLKAPLVLSPKDDSTPICRWHNYDPEGCKRRSECIYDHEHCHWCKKVGHTALNCNS
ncbi:hypothetical protein ACHAWF_011961 [Thalassiosira exigua]